MVSINLLLPFIYVGNPIFQRQTSNVLSTALCQTLIVFAVRLGKVHVKVPYTLKDKINLDRTL